MGRPALTIVSPLPPTRSGIADYCAEQAVALAEEWDLTIVIDDREPEPEPPAPGITVLRRAAWRPHAGERRLYHLGNNPFHEYVWRALHDWPGVTVLHDFVLHHLIGHITVGRRDLAGYARAMRAQYGAMGERLAAQRRMRLFSNYQQFLLPLNASVVRASAATIVHSAEAARALTAEDSDAVVRVIPHHHAPPPAAIAGLTRAEARRRLSLPEDETIIVSLGFVTPAKQVELAVEALAGLKASLPPFRYVLAGEQNSPALAAKIKECGMADRVSAAGYVDAAAFHLYILAADLIVNLRYPTAGETSGTLIRALGMGACVMVFDYGSFAEYPDDCVIKVPLDTFDPAPLRAALAAALAAPEACRAIGERARRHIARHHGLAACARLYSEVLRGVEPGERGGYKSGGRVGAAVEVS